MRKFIFNRECRNPSIGQYCILSLTKRWISFKTTEVTGFRFGGTSIHLLYKGNTKSNNTIYLVISHFLIFTFSK